MLMLEFNSFTKLIRNRISLFEIVKVFKEPFVLRTDLISVSSWENAWKTKTFKNASTTYAKVKWQHVRIGHARCEPKEDGKSYVCCCKSIKHSAAVRQSDACIRSRAALSQVSSTMSQGGLGSFLAGTMDQKRRLKMAEVNCRLICI